MKEKKWDDPEFIKQFEQLEAQNLKRERESLPELLADLSFQLQQLMDNHPEEYWEAAIKMDRLPTLLPRRPAEQKEWRDEHTEKGIILSGKRGRLFDPNKLINKDVVEAHEAVKQMQLQWKNCNNPYAKKQRALKPLSEDNVEEWWPFIKDAFMAIHKQCPEDTAHAAESIEDRLCVNPSDEIPTVVRTELCGDLKGALKMLAKDLDRVRR